MPGAAALWHTTPPSDAVFTRVRLPGEFHEGTKVMADNGFH